MQCPDIDFENAVSIRNHAFGKSNGTFYEVLSVVPVVGHYDHKK